MCITTGDVRFTKGENSSIVMSETGYFAQGGNALCVKISCALIGDMIISNCKGHDRLNSKHCLCGFIIVYESE